MSLLEKIKKEYELVGIKDVELREYVNADAARYELVIVHHSPNLYDYGEGMEEKFLEPINKIREIQRTNIQLKSELDKLKAQSEHRIKHLEKYETFYNLYKELK